MGQGRFLRSLFKEKESRIMNNKTQEKFFAFLAYLLSFIGALYVLLVRRENEFAVYHARQSLGIAIIATGIFLAWAVAGWILSWIPIVGFILAIVFFSLVIAMYILLTISCIKGMLNTLRYKKQSVPVVGEYAALVSSCLLEKVGHV